MKRELFLLIIKTGVNSSGGYTSYYPDGYNTQEEVETDWNKLVQCKDELIANIDNTGSDFVESKVISMIGFATTIPTTVKRLLQT